MAVRSDSAPSPLTTLHSVLLQLSLLFLVIITSSSHVRAQEPNNNGVAAETNYENYLQGLSQDEPNDYPHAFKMMNTTIIKDSNSSEEGAVKVVETVAPDNAQFILKTDDGASGGKTVEAPIINFIHKKVMDEKTKTMVDLISLEENTIRLGPDGKISVLINAEALPKADIKGTLRQLTLKYRRQCNNPDASITDKIRAGLVTQESSVKPVKDQLYLLKIDLCKKNAHQTFSLSFLAKKSLRSKLSKMGSVLSNVAAAAILTRYVTLRMTPEGQFRVPNGDNGGVLDTIVATLPLGAIVYGVEGVKEVFEEYIPSEYNSVISTCVTAALMGSGIKTLDRDFQSNTEMMFISNAGRLYLRSAYFNKLYECLKELVVDNIVYHYSGNQNVTGNFEEATSSSTSALISTLMMAAHRYVYQAELDLMNEQGHNKLELATLGTEVRGGAVATAYKTVDALDRTMQHNMQIDNSWTAFFIRTALMQGINLAAVFSLKKVLPDHGSMLTAGVMTTANLIEASYYQTFSLVDEYLAKPVTQYVTDALVSRDLTVPDSYFHRGTKRALRLGINFATTYAGIRVVNGITNTMKSYYPAPQIQAANIALDLAQPVAVAEEVAANALGEAVKIPAHIKSRYFLDVVAGVATNGIAAPFVFNLNKELFILVFDGASYLVCNYNGWAIGCPTNEYQLSIMLHKEGTKAPTHYPQPITTIK